MYVLWLASLVPMPNLGAGKFVTWIRKAGWYYKEDGGKYNTCSLPWCIHNGSKTLTRDGRQGLWSRSKWEKASCIHWPGSSLKLEMLCGKCPAAAVTCTLYRWAIIVHLLSLRFLFFETVCVDISIIALLLISKGIFMGYTIIRRYYRSPLSSPICTHLHGVWLCPYTIK